MIVLPEFTAIVSICPRYCSSVELPPVRSPSMSPALSLTATVAAATGSANIAGTWPIATPVTSSAAPGIMENTEPAPSSTCCAVAVA